MRPEEQPYMGLAEVAEYCGVTKQVVSNWRRRDKMPSPLTQLALGPVWTTAQIVAWNASRIESR